MKFKLAVFLLLIIFNINLVIAEESIDPLQNFLNDFKSLEANFVQSLINENGEELERTEGLIYLQQPNKLHWSYEIPYAQKIISNGEILWVFDEDLEQLTIRKMGNAFDETPAGIILGNNDIKEHFIQVSMGEIEGFDWIELTPKNIEAQYKNIRLGFDNTTLGMIIIHDNLGQTTRIDFSNSKKNVKLSSSLFEFVTPEGIDVIDEREIVNEAQNNS